MNKHFPLIFLCLSLVACKGKEKTDTIVSMQMVDRNGFSETISNQDRLKTYQDVDFLLAQPYEKVLRVYGKDLEGKSPSKLTTYHKNGGVWQFLEAVDGRANGRYLEWHPNGRIKIEARVIEGLADLSETAQASWLFDGPCNVFDEKGSLQAEFFYEKGNLEKEAKYFFPKGNIQKVIPYTSGLVDGNLLIYDEEGFVLESIPYKKGMRDGAATGDWEKGLSKYQEQYREGLLINGIYFDREGKAIAEIENGHGLKAHFADDILYTLSEYNEGKPDGEVKHFTKEGFLQSSYVTRGGKKNGEEWEFYPEFSQELQPKLLVTWTEDKIEGMVKTWYENGVLESQREMSNNQKHGLSFAYYRNGDLMLMEEYDNGKLVNGSYYKKGEKDAVSTIEKGEGVANLYNSEGHFMKKISYERGKPLID